MGHLAAAWYGVDTEIKYLEFVVLFLISVGSDEWVVPAFLTVTEVACWEEPARLVAWQV